MVYFKIQINEDVRVPGHRKGMLLRSKMTLELKTINL